MQPKKSVLPSFQYIKDDFVNSFIHLNIWKLKSISNVSLLMLPSQPLTITTTNLPFMALPFWNHITHRLCLDSFNFRIFSRSPIFWHISVFILYNTPLYRHTTFYLSIHQLMDISDCFHWLATTEHSWLLCAHTFLPYLYAHLRADVLVMTNYI